MFKSEYDKKIQELQNEIDRLKKEKETAKTSCDDLIGKWWRYKFGLYEIIFYPTSFISDEIDNDTNNFYHEFRGILFHITYDEDGNIAQFRYDNEIPTITTEDVQKCKRLYYADDEIQKFLSKIVYSVKNC